MMDQLWAPWRLSYVANPKPERGEHEERCFVCRALKSTPDQDAANLLVRRGKQTAVILNRFPYNNGHLLIVPNRHVAALDLLTHEELLELQLELIRQQAALRRLMNPDGFNIGLNLGSAAGAGLPGHLHWHIVPRWSGDCNFMPVVADTKVIVQSLDVLWRLLDEELRREVA